MLKVFDRRRETLLNGLRAIPGVTCQRAQGAFYLFPNIAALGMDADAFAAFTEAGDPFDPETAAKLERYILSAGGSDEGEALYTAFRGRMPGVEALLEGRGLTDS